MSKYSILLKNDNKLTKKQRRRKKRLARRLIGLFIVLIQIIFTVLFVISIFKANVLPTKYLVIGLSVIGIITLFNFISQYNRYQRLGKLLALLMILLCIVGTKYMDKFTDMLSNITGGNEQKVSMSVIVLSSDSADSINKIGKYTFGYNSKMDSSYTSETIGVINSTLNTTIKTTPANDWNSLISGLYNKQYGAIIVNEAYRNNLLELFPDFSTRTKVIYKYEISINVQAVDDEKDVTVEPFAMYISGNDLSGGEEGAALLDSGRSDVNIICVVNPTTRQVLLISSPRDSYVTIFNNDGKSGLDKLTHAGLFGIDGSIKAMENLFDVKIDYYAKINFTGAINLVDAMGGITVESELDFYTHPDTSPITYHFVEGPNECDGEKALAFCRERQNLAAGDLQRGRNQMIAINGIIDKICSSAILTKFSGIMDSISSFFVTNMPANKIQALIKSTLNDMNWNVQKYSVDVYGQQGMDSAFFDQHGMWVVIPYDYSLKAAQHMVDLVEAGTIFDVDEIADQFQNPASANTNATTNTTATNAVAR